MRTVHKARLVPDSAPDGLTTKVIRVQDLGVPIAAALGRWEALTDNEIHQLADLVYKAGVPRFGKYWNE
jgi:hypothetical protein